jgi:hypothetical protein
MFDRLPMNSLVINIVSFLSGRLIFMGTKNDSGPSKKTAGKQAGMTKI